MFEILENLANYVFYVCCIYTFSIDIINGRYGYRGNDCRKNIHVLANGEIVYFMSYIAIIYNINLHVQKHYTEHTDDIKRYI